MQKSSFNSLFEILLRPRRLAAIRIKVSFNSLFEIRLGAPDVVELKSYYLFQFSFWDSEDYDGDDERLLTSYLSILFLRFPPGPISAIRGHIGLAFNSLFEIQARVAGRPRDEHVNFQFSFWDSRLNGLRPTGRLTGTSLSILFLRFLYLPAAGCRILRCKLSILFLRFGLKAVLEGWGRWHDFQFSFWDSREQRRDSRGAGGAFQFSFWDSWFTRQMEQWASRLSILFLRFLDLVRRNYWLSGDAFQFSFWDSSSMRAAVRSAATMTTFNSLFEIPEQLDCLLDACRVKPFQFSFWDSLLKT